MNQFLAEGFEYSKWKKNICKVKHNNTLIDMFR